MPLLDRGTKIKTASSKHSDITHRRLLDVQRHAHSISWVQVQITNYPGVHILRRRGHMSGTLLPHWSEHVCRRFTRLAKLLEQLLCRVVEFLQLSQRQWVLKRATWGQGCFNVAQLSSGSRDLLDFSRRAHRNWRNFFGERIIRLTNRLTLILNTWRKDMVERALLPHGRVFVITLIWDGRKLRPGLQITLRLFDTLLWNRPSSRSLLNVPVLGVTRDFMYIFEVTPKISALRKGLLAHCTGKGPLTCMLSEMISKIATLLENALAASMPAFKIQFDALSA